MRKSCDGCKIWWHASWRCINLTCIACSSLKKRRVTSSMRASMKTPTPSAPTHTHTHTGCLPVSLSELICGGVSKKKDPSSLLLPPYTHTHTQPLAPPWLQPKNPWQLSDHKFPQRCACQMFLSELAALLLPFTALYNLSHIFGSIRRHISEASLRPAGRPSVAQCSAESHLAAPPYHLRWSYFQDQGRPRLICPSDDLSR